MSKSILENLWPFMTQLALFKPLCFILHVFHNKNDLENINS